MKTTSVDPRGLLLFPLPPDVLLPLQRNSNAGISGWLQPDLQKAHGRLSFYGYDRGTGVVHQLSLHQSDEGLIHEYVV